MVSQLEALNPELLKSIQNATSQEQRVKLAADALDKEADASKRAAIATVLFGDAGTRMVEVFKGGSAAIDQSADAARNMGLVIDREVLANAEAMNDQLSIATKVIDAEFAKALVDIAPLLVSAAQLAGDVAAAIGSIVDAMREVENQSTRKLNNTMAELGAKRLDIENQILELQDKQRNTDRMNEPERRGEQTERQDCDKHWRHVFNGVELDALSAGEIGVGDVAGCDLERCTPVGDVDLESQKEEQDQCDVEAGGLQGRHV